MSDAAQALAERSAAAMYANDRASQSLGMRILETRPGYAKLAMLVREDMLNGVASCHGGLIFSLADSAFAFSCNSHGGTVVAAAAAIDFLAPARGGDELTAVAVERWRSKRNGVYEVTVANQNGDTIALFRGRSHVVG
ncbi:hydroxyphenylacetyl-CoA thioesterase PaaI [Steroidobacter sp.]|uniref:hydroxyphenylacetyl-CoA thioesterase PaaI n=1 Tax=Steroidobacter sp. TaxID=1978227 RepID=UPI001A3D6A37|nr:hydroxyphenylacetyl-CoA thioesterase PaaI [Steroidobacter sp.]MBL8268291.1 hydroxyphenylacetyl-CoA thioesterase PaaI [Steroidobacter sp.]